MLMLGRRLAVWALETLAQVPLLMGLLLLLALFSAEPIGNIGLFELRFLLFAVVLFVVGSGYLITTSIAAALLPRKNRVFYSMIAAALYVTHAHLFINGLNKPDDIHQVLLYATGAIAVFACTFVGGRFVQPTT
jgi:hypothetical protein